MATHIVKYSQTLLDIAIMRYGSADAVVRLAQENGLSITAVLDAGQEISYTPTINNVAGYFSTAEAIATYETES